MVLANATNRYMNSRYVVDNVTAGSPYTTIQSAINAAVAEGGNAEIWVRQGTYNENLTLYDGVNVEGAEQTLSILIGTHTPPASGQFRFTRMGLRSATHIFSSAAAGTTTLSCLRCQFQITNGYVYNLTNWTGELRARWCTDYSTNNGVVYNTGGSVVTMNHSLIGKGSGQTFTANGNVTLFSVDLGCPILLNGTGTSILEGGSVFEGNVATGGTHTLTLAQVRITTGATQAITHNSASTAILNEVIVNTSNATAIGGTGTLQVMSVQFPNSNTLAGTLTTLLTGVTRTAEMWSDNITRMKYTGFYSWAAAGPYFDDTTLGTFKLLVGGTGYIQGKRITWVAQDYTGMTAGNTYIIYIDSTGTIGATTTHTDATYENYIVLFECMRDSTTVNNQVTVSENHPYSFPTSPSNYLHDTAGIVIENNQGGANITLNGTQGIQINGADVLNDHGISTTIPDSSGAAVAFYKYYTNAGGKWARQNATTTFTGFWNNAGTATALTAGYFAVYRLYVSKQSLNTATPTYFAVLHTAQFNTINAARAVVTAGSAAAPTNELALLELCQLGFIIYQQSSSSIVQVTISKSTLRSSTSSGGTNVASLVTTSTTNFDGVLSSSDTNVQAALETIDEYRGGLFRVEATGDGTLVSNRGYIIKNATPANLTTMTLPATPIQGDTIAITGYTAGGWKVAQNANQQIFMGNQSSTIGVGGYIASTLAKDCVRIVCVTAGASAEWVVVFSMGNLTVV